VADWFLFCIVHCLSASGTADDAAGLAPSPDDAGVLLLLLQAAPNPTDATSMNSLESLFI
jgi:hypothetical protein